MANPMNVEQVKYLANLARLAVPEDQLESVAHDMEAIIGFVDQIQKASLDTMGAEEYEKENIFRDDMVTPIVPAHDLIEAAPQHQDHFVKVTKVIE
ncbi:MAG: gatC [Candidatus Nomurabacteria bacterium]|nr:gatC [Candidatus Nomurabacteria bacterium]